MEDAACKGKTEVMFPRFFNDKGYVHAARALCRECPVSSECLEYALEFPPQDMHGIWAGKSKDQLAGEQRRRGIKPVRPSIQASLELLRRKS